ncbi:succinylglutamate desuccinylase/aspartoacylase family protein [Ulvibacterium sp.]|uniref:succinylglutamate desuccinylase/aspartoacylase family protein n=1 Tax=Ulvibacterium sp. TaxID=2665914 RepID=UPI00261D42FF|nr:M14 family metallopeptidase [Ulvibacterium sp.]
MRFIPVLLVFLVAYAQALGQRSFPFSKTSVPPGSKKHFKIPVSDGNNSTYIPITVFHGANPGPVLGITAGIHGYEYPPILAAQRLNQQIDPNGLSGTIILVQIANVPAFLGRSPFVNPIDGKNLNRSFPGKEEGSITERIAHIITKEVIAKSSFFVDMHGGDAPEDLQPYNSWYQSDILSETSKKGQEMALAMGFDYVIVFNISKERLEKPSLFCSQEAFHRNIPSVDIECGRLGMPGNEETNQIVQGVFSLLGHLNMMSITRTPKKTPIIVAKRSTIKSRSTGFFCTDKKAGDTIKAGTQVGYITDFFGTKLEDISSPQDGIILYMIGTPPINAGETLMNIGILPNTLNQK